MCAIGRAGSRRGRVRLVGSAADVSDADGEVAAGALGAAADGAVGLALSLAAGGDATGEG